MKYPLNLGCTVWQHQKIGVNAVVNARAGRQDLNSWNEREWDLWRDADEFKRLHHSDTWNWRSQWFRRHFPDLAAKVVFTD